MKMAPGQRQEEVGEGTPVLPERRQWLCLVHGPVELHELHLLHGWEEVYFPKRLMEAALGGVGMKGCKLKVKQSRPGNTPSVEGSQSRSGLWPRPSKEENGLGTGEQVCGVVEEGCEGGYCGDSFLSSLQDRNG